MLDKTLFILLEGLANSQLYLLSFKKCKLVVAINNYNQKGTGTTITHCKKYVHKTHFLYLTLSEKCKWHT